MTLSKTSRAIPPKTTTAAEAHRQSVLAKKNVLVAAENDAHRHGLGATAAKQASAEVRRKAHFEEFSGRHNKMQMDLQEAVAMSAEAATKSPKPIAAETASLRATNEEMRKEAEEESRRERYRQVLRNMRAVAKHEAKQKASSLKAPRASLTDITAVAPESTPILATDITPILATENWFMKDVETEQQQQQQQEDALVLVAAANPSAVADRAASSVAVHALLELFTMVASTFVGTKAQRCLKRTEVAVYWASRIQGYIDEFHQRSPRTPACVQGPPPTAPRCTIAHKPFIEKPEMIALEKALKQSIRKAARRAATERKASVKEARRQEMLRAAQELHHKYLVAVDLEAAARAAAQAEAAARGEAKRTKAAETVAEIEELRRSKVCLAAKRRASVLVKGASLRREKEATEAAAEALRRAAAAKAASSRRALAIKEKAEAEAKRAVEAKEEAKREAARQATVLAVARDPAAKCPPTQKRGSMEARFFAGQHAMSLPDFNAKRKQRQEAAAATRRAMPGGMVSTMVFKIEGDIKKAKPRTPWLAKQG